MEDLSESIPLSLARLPLLLMQTRVSPAGQERQRPTPTPDRPSVQVNRQNRLPHLRQR